MVAKQWGRIVNVSSIAATGGLHNQAAYAASKAGLIGLTQTVTLELARHGITCNAILPGLIGTENVQRMPAEIRDAAIAAIPARRLGEPREIGQLIAFLASDRAAFINGAAIPVCGRCEPQHAHSRKQKRACRDHPPRAVFDAVSATSQGPSEDARASANPRASVGGDPGSVGNPAELARVAPLDNRASWSHR